MHEIFTQDHEQWRATLRSFVEKEVIPNVQAWEEEGCIPRSLFAKVGDLGGLGLRLPEAAGGAGLDFWYTAVFIQEFIRCGSVGVPVSLLAHAEFATKTIQGAGNPELIDNFVAPAARGELIGALGVTEPGAGSDVAALRTSARRDGGDYVINGSKIFITNGTIADFVTLAVRTGEPGHKGISLIVVPTDTKGFTAARRLRKIGTHSSDTAELFFEDCRVPAHHLIGAEGEGFKLIMKGFEAERLILALIACAQMRLMLDEAKAYGRERIIFGQPILANQVWRHRFADVLTTIHAAEALTYQAITIYEAGVPSNGQISMAKLFATEAAKKAASECAQIFGGMAQMEECLMARLYRDTLGFSVGAGSSEVMREIISREAQLGA